MYFITIRNKSTNIHVNGVHVFLSRLLAWKTCKTNWEKENKTPTEDTCRSAWLRLFYQLLFLLCFLVLEVRWGEVMVNWCFTSFFNHVWLYMAVGFHSWRNKLFPGVNQQPSVGNWQLPLMGFEPQWRGASSFKARRLTHSATEAPYWFWTTYVYWFWSTNVYWFWSIYVYMQGACLHAFISWFEGALYERNR